MTQHNPPAELVSVLNNYSEPAILLSLDYRILGANKAYRVLYGDAPVTKRRLCYEVSHGYKVPCDQAGETCPLKNALATKQPQRVLHLHHTPNGEEHVDVETLPIKNDTGDIVYLIEVLRHIKVASSHAEGQSLVGRSPSFNKMLEMIERVAPTSINVLLLGESGTGKELVAQAIHESSPRAKAPLVPLECSGLSETLFESELFGHEKGAFTGAVTSKQGLVESATGGTLFLDEVGDIPLNLQVKLLRLLETGTFRRVGSLEPRKADFRLICATHRNLKAMVSEGTFRQDLYFRIASFPIHLPSLQERQEDIPLLVETILKRIHGDNPPKMDEEALACLKRYAFTGNVRELRNILEWAGLMADGDTIMLQHLPDDIRAACNEHIVHSSNQGYFSAGEIIPLEQLEENYLAWALARHKGDKRSLAEALGISERTLYRKLELLSK